VFADVYVDVSKDYLYGISIAVLPVIHPSLIAHLRAFACPQRFDTNATRFDVEEC
jgi:hypothetical protein